MHKLALPLILTLGAGQLSALPQAAAWPEFQGPGRTSTVPALETDFDWGDAGPEILWRVATGPGYGGAAVRDGQVVLFDRELGAKDVLRVLALESGEELWSVPYDAPGRLSFHGSRNVPSVQDDLIVTVGGFGHVSAFDREQRELLWQVDMPKVFGGEIPMFGWSAAPLVSDGRVIVTALGEDVGLVALDLRTGETLWKTGGVGTSHSTPALMQLAGREQLVFLSTTYAPSGKDSAAPTTLTSFDPKSGAELWRTETSLTRVPIPGPLRIDDQHFLITGGYRGGTKLMKISEQDGEFELEALFHHQRGSQIHTPVRLGQHVYMLANENWNYGKRRQAEGGLMCLGLDGEEAWRTEDDPYFGRGAAILAGEHLLIQDGFDGTLRVVHATPERYELVAEADIFGPEYAGKDGKMWAPLALAGNLLVMRSQSEIVCVRL